MNYSAYKNVNLLGGLLREKQELNRKITIHAVWKQFENTGRIGAFSCVWEEGMEQKPHIFWDSDVAKWMEGASYILAKTRDKELEAKIESLIDKFETNQQPDGYFNIYYTVCEPGMRFTKRENHELYCAGHFIEAAVAYYEATGKDRFLKLVMRYADLIDQTFHIKNSAAFTTPGHEEIELALIRLYQATNEPRYLALSKFFIEHRGANEKDGHRPSSQDFPIRSQRTATGHSVRCLYLYTAVSALAKELGDSELARRCQDIFFDIYSHKLYITGGVGSTNLYEGFTQKFDLPNRGAYAETCAAISLAYFCRNLLDLEKKSVYADVLERTLFNGILSGLSIDGKAFFYENPLEINVKINNRLIDAAGTEHHAATQRKEVFDCSCCPPNINRFIEEYESFLYDREGESVYVHILAESTFDDGTAHVETHTNYPLDGKAKIVCRGAEFLCVRVPDWCSNFTASSPYTMENGYARFHHPGTVSLEFHMDPVLVEANLNVQNNIGRAALMFGPLVYCAESVDNGENLHALYVNQNLNAKVAFDPFFGANVIETDGFRKLQNSTALYRPYSENFFEKTRIKFIPYFGFANRGESDMLVYFKVKEIN